MDTKHPDSEIIDALGGTVAVARLCKVKPPSVSDWRKEGIPSARRMYLQAVRPEAFEPPPELATAAPAQQEAA